MKTKALLICGFVFAYAKSRFPHNAAHIGSSLFLDRMCPGNKKPLKEGGLQLFCGRGPNRQECPEGSTCVIDPADGYAVCCPSASVGTFLLSLR